MENSKDKQRGTVTDNHAASAAGPSREAKAATAQPATGGTAGPSGSGSATTEARKGKAVFKSKPKSAETSENANLNARLSKLEELVTSFIQSQTETRSRSQNESESQPRVASGRMSFSGSATGTGTQAPSTEPLYADTLPYDGPAEPAISDSEMGQIGEEEELYNIPDEVPSIAAKFAVNSDIGEPIDDGIARSATYLLSHQLEQQVLDDTAAKYPLPSNCQAVDSPKVNPIIWDNLPTLTKTRDLKLQKIQKSLTRGLNAFTHSISSEDISDSAQDALALLCNANFELNCLRKDLIKPDLNSRYTHLCKPDNPVSKLLFGDNLSKKVKDMNDEQKATAGVMIGQRKPHTGFHPYKGYRPASMQAGYDRQRTYREAGWSRSYAPSTATHGHGPATGSSQRSFLDQRGGRQPRPPPAGKNPRHANRRPPATQTQRTR